MATGKDGRNCWFEIKSVTEKHFSQTVALIVDGTRYEAKIENAEAKKSLNPVKKPIDPETGEEIDIDLDDPKTQKAATKIQVRTI